MDEHLEQRFQELLEAVQKSKEIVPRQRALSQLMDVFWPIAEGLLLKHRKKREFLLSQYDDDMQEIFDSSIKYFIEHIDEFDMAKAKGAQGSIKFGLMHWFEKVCRLEYAVLDYCEARSQRPISLDTPVGEGDITLLDVLEDRSADGIPKLSGLEKFIKDLQAKSDRAVARAIDEILREDPFLESNPQQRLSTCHPKKDPASNCQIIFQLQKKYQRLTAVSQELGVNHQTLNSHYRRHCIPLMQALVKQRLGYDPMSELPLAQS